MNANYKPYKRYHDEFKRDAVELMESSGIFYKPSNKPSSAAVASFGRAVPAEGHRRLTTLRSRLRRNWPS